MRLLRSSARLFLLAALLVPALAFYPGLMHVFDVPKTAAWEVFVALAGALAFAAAGGPGEKGAGWWWALWGAWALAALWLALATGGHAVFVGDNLNEFPVLFRARDWLYRHWTFGLDLSGTGPGDWMFRAGEGLAAATLAERAWRSEAVRTSGLGPLATMGLLLAALWFLSAAVSLRPDLASPPLLDWCGYLLVFALVWRADGAPGMRGRILAALLLGAALNALYGLVQAAGQDPIPWAEKFGGRASGFFGNPDFLGGHLALFLPLSLALALLPSPGFRALRWCLVCLLGSALLATQTRGAVVGAALGCAVALAACRRADPGLLRANVRGLGFSALAVALSAAALWAVAPGPAAGRLAGTFGRDPEAGRRIYLMQKTAQIAGDHPLLGVGPGDFRVWFPSVEVRGLRPQDYGSRPYTVSEHGHNDFLQMAADAGWPAALLWAALCVLVLWGLVRGPVRAPLAGEGILAAGCLGALVAVRVHGMANFPFRVVPTESAAWAVAAVGLRAAGFGTPRDRPAGSGIAWRWLAAALVAAATLLAVRGRQAFEDGLWWRGAGELGLKHPVTASPILLKALGVDPREDRLWDLHGQSHFDRGDIWQSIGSLREAHRLDPYDAETALRLGLALIENRLYDQAYAVLSGAAEYAPNYPDLWEPLVVAAYEDKRYAAAVQACDWMLYYHVHEENAYTNKAAALGSLGLYTQARYTLLDAQREFPESGKVQLNLAITLYKMGQKKSAYKAWQKAAALIPSDPQVDELRKALKP